MKRILDLYIHSMKNYAKFSGRACRMEAISFYPFFFVLKLLPIVFLTLPSILRHAGYDISSFINLNVALFFISIVLLILHIIPCFSLGARRLHDFNITGWLQLIMLLPVVYLVFFIIYCVVPGTGGDNDYGPVSEKY